MRCWLRLASFPLLALLAQPANAGVSTGGDILDSAVPLSDDELDEQRGGFRWQGVDIKLGAEIRSFLDGQLVMQTNVSWQAGAGETTRWVSGALTPAGAAELQAGMAARGHISMSVGSDKVYLANGGRTAFVQNDDGPLRNIVINTASNVAIRQEVEAVIDVNNMEALQAQLGVERIGEALASMITSAGAFGPN